MSTDARGRSYALREPHMDARHGAHLGTAAAVVILVLLPIDPIRTGIALYHVLAGLAIVVTVSLSCDVACVPTLRYT